MSYFNFYERSMNFFLRTSVLFLSLVLRARQTFWNGGSTILKGENESLLAGRGAESRISLGGARALAIGLTWLV